jgi:hypothetical protein
MNAKKILETYDVIVINHKAYLEEFGVKMPALKAGGGYTKNALVLVLLAENYPNTGIKSKSDVTRFVRGFYPDTLDCQQARHLSLQAGFWIESGGRGSITTATLKNGDYWLKTLDRPYPSFIPNRREPIADWDDMLRIFDYRCGHCHSQEGRPHYRYKTVITKLQQAHLDPRLPLDWGNCIPMCQKCNQSYGNRFVFDDRGIITEAINSG